MKLTHTPSVFYAVLPFFKQEILECSDLRDISLVLILNDTFSPGLLKRLSATGNFVSARNHT